MKYTYMNKKKPLISLLQKLFCTLMLQYHIWGFIRFSFHILLFLCCMQYVNFVMEETLINNTVLNYSTSQKVFSKLCSSFLPWCFPSYQVFFGVFFSLFSFTCYPCSIALSSARSGGNSKKGTSENWQVCNRTWNPETIWYMLRSSFFCKNG